MWMIRWSKKNQAQQIHKNFGIIGLADVYNEADENKETIKCVLTRKIEESQNKLLILKVRKGSHAFSRLNWHSSNRGWWEEGHLGTLWSESRLVEHWGDPAVGATEQRRTALSHTGWEWTALIEITAKSKTGETPGSLKFAANFRLGTSRSELVEWPFGWPQTRASDPACFRLVHASFLNNQVSGPCGFPGDLRR